MLRSGLSGVIRKFALVLLLLVYSSVHGSEKNGEYASLGSVSCEEYEARYIENRKARSGPDEVSVAFAQITGWVLGYLTSYNRWVDNGKRDVVEGVEHDRIFEWLLNFCRKFPDHNTNLAMFVLVHELDK
ncbi:MAG: hypothetical protein DWQ08_09140 [Proteobacteria bacterium]|nr:MAG: hypothetical protein DWQ08_09140 [Pseudomonadota bacterium]